MYAQDYWNANITLTYGTNKSAFEALASVIDPLVYKENLTMPKLVIDATGDEFFMPGTCCVQCRCAVILCVRSLVTRFLVCACTCRR